MNARHSFMPGSSVQLGSVGSFRYCVLSIPTDFSGPAGCITVPTEVATLVMKNVGFQLRSLTLRIDCAANFGIAATSNTLAPELCNSDICESIVASVVS